MFWAVLALSAIAVALIKLGALSVWVTFLSAALKLLVLLAILAVLFAMWRLVFRS